MSWRKINNLELEWNLSDFYDSLDDEKYQKDFLLLQKLAKNFIKNYSMKIHTFHTMDDFLLFYQDFEKIVSIFEKLKYFITFLQTKDIYNKNFFLESQKIDEISNSIVNSIDESFKLCDKNFFEFFEKKLSENPNFPYKYLFSQDLKNYKRNNIIKNYEEINRINSEISILENNYQTFLNDFYSWKISENIFLQNSQEIYKNLFKFRKQYSDLHKYENIFSQKMEEFSLNSDVFDICINSCNNFFENFDFSKLENNFYYENIRISFDDFILFLQKFFDFLENSEMKKLFLEIIAWKVDFLPSENKRNDNFTASIKDFGSYISLNFNEKISDILTFVHEFGHCYQAFKSQKQNILQFQPSAFMTEISAVFFEKKILDFCDYNINQNKNVELSKVLKNIIFKRFQDNIYFSFLISNIEFELYKNNNFKLNSVSEMDFYLTSHIFYKPFYVSSYIFANIWAIYFSDNKNFSKFEKMCEFGWSEDLQKIFDSIKIDIFDENIYKNSLNYIFSTKYE